MAEENFKIDFIGLGAGRSGSTWINYCLSEHPEICMPREKKLHFFGNDFKYSKGIEYYKKRFFNCDQGKVIGENTPGYLESPKTAKRIYNLFKNIKLFVCLRNPIEVAYSRFYYEKAKEQEPTKTFEEAISGPKKNYYLIRGNYYTHLKRYLELFPKQNILILIYEDIANDPMKFMGQIYEFLNVNNSFVAQSATKRINTSTINKKLVFIPWFNNFINYFKRRHNNIIITVLRETLKIFGLVQLLNYLRGINKKKINTKFEPKPPINNKTREELYNYYRNEIINLEKLIDRNLGFWK